MTREELDKLCSENTVVSVPVAGEALGIGYSKAYEAARAGEIPTVPLGKTIRRVPTVWLRKVLLEDPLHQPAA